MVNAKAQLLLKERFQLTEQAFAELVIWRVPEPLRGSAHRFKYRLALIENGACTVRYDNEAGKGDHKHLHERQTAYRFSDIETLQADFWSDVERRMTR
jgi:hypothetical protein